MKEVIVPADDLVCLGKEKLQELIRCKDCEWYEIDIIKSDGTVDRRYKPTWCRFWENHMNSDDYCSRAERKEE